MRSPIVRPMRLYLVIVGVIAMFVGSLAAWKWPHLSFYFSDLNSPTFSTQVPALGKEPAVPSDWRQIEVGGQSFRLPPDMLQKVVLKPESRVVQVGNQQRMVIVFLPKAREPESPYSERPPQISNDPVLRMAFIFESSPKDFDWRMSRTELRSLQWALSQKQMPVFSMLDNTSFHKRIEADWSAILTIHHWATFEWWSDDTEGHISFVATRMDDTQILDDTQWLKAIARTFEPGDRVFADDVSEEDLRPMVDGQPWRSTAVATE